LQGGSQHVEGVPAVGLGKRRKRSCNQSGTATDSLPARVAIAGIIGSAW
jgi:hypothetical protein